ncbi:branched-chain amino acid ABC transporter permease [Chelatococcus sp. SYSU_G07232]|uniref:Branched-chain amino acid ABC transporter permease n=1 Tax=Chelatococcus albus TaxID=3047466 RepID=A0ABT7AC48_9HYPH|nr:branched-chain amino acid ABC transporter permease [Chelatococcus sp. SYSU_G07232]MDJ1156942.1 branched-chain amino acid ABC transporter permease [Chelatococcus sp. SYSU_G07232]
MRRAAPAVLAILLLLSACGTVVDADQARTCRLVIPALNPEDTAIRVVRTMPGPWPNSLRVDYRAERTGQAARNRYVLCRFAGAGLSTEKALLTGVATERGPLPDPSFYFLKRFYLEAFGSSLRDPGAGDPAVETAAVPWPVAYGLQQTLGALPLASIYGLLAAAYALVFGLVGRINLAFGEFAALGGSAATVGIAMLLAGGVTTPVAGLATGLFFALFAAALHGFAAARVGIAPIRQATGQQVLIATTGLAIALSEYLRLTQGATTRWVPPVWNTVVPLAHADDFVVTITPMALLVAGVGFLAASGLLALMRLSPFGRAWRAYADDPKAAALFGVDGRRLFDLTFVVACALAGLAGFVMTAFYGGVGFAAGLSLGLKALVAAILGGIGSVPGAFVGGLAVGFGEALWSATMPIEARDIAIYALLVVILIFRPGGLFGYGDRLPRPV